MNIQEPIDYQRIERAIGYILTHFKRQPSLDEVAEHIHLSPFHFQRLFSEWAGVSPKKFLQYLSIEHAKNLLNKTQTTVFEAAIETGLSGPSRLHDLFISIEGMTPGEYKNGGESLSINYSFYKSPFGNLLIASTAKGICHMAFSDDNEVAFQHLAIRFPKATLIASSDPFQQNAIQIFSHNWENLNEIKLHLKGSDFQLKVWETLLKIPVGKLSSYQQIAEKVNNPNASRAVGSAIASNPIAYLIPCHRVIQSTGHFGNYRWGSTRKTAMIGWESAIDCGF